MDTRIGKRLGFIDFIRGVAILSMIVNHTEHAWLHEGNETLRNALSYLTVTTAAPLFLFLAGFSLSLSLARSGAMTYAWAMHSTQRALWLIIVGYLLNRVLFPGMPQLMMGPLQTIGLSTLILIPVLPFLASRSITCLLVLISVIFYGAFAGTVPMLHLLIASYPTWGEMFFFSISFWPWASLVFLGAALGGRWCACDTDVERGKLLSRAAGFGLLLVLFGLVLNGFFDTDDYIISYQRFSNWYPGLSTACWITGLTPIFMFLVHAIEKTQALPQWLLRFGQHALMIYVVHRIFVVAVMGDGLRFSVTTWSSFAVANVLLVIMLSALIKLQRRIKKRIIVMLAST